MAGKRRKNMQENIADFIPSPSIEKEKEKTKSRKAQFIQGCKDSVPICFGYIPAAITFSGLALSSGLSFWQTMAMSSLLYSGAGQMSTCNMLDTGAPAVLIIITIVILNLRHVVMSSIVISDNPGTPKRRLFWILLGLTDEVFGLYSASDSNRKLTPFWLLGCGICAWCYWQIGTLIGLFTLSLLPDLVLNAFGVSLYAMFAALLTGAIVKKPKLLLSVGTAVILNWILAQFIDSSIAIIASAIISAVGASFVLKPEDVKS
jgi:predicted branched-subunit amino acid permease